jgi:predicted amidohydrolase
MTVFALEQTAPVPGRLTENTEEISSRAGAALRDGADIVVLPELAATGYVTDPDAVARLAQPLDGPLVGLLTDLTRRRGGLVAVGYAESAGGEHFNSVALVGRDGPVLNYRKVHLFDAEHDAFAAGDELPVVATEHAVIGVCVCYDLRFVEVLRTLSLRGADVVLAPAAWTGGFDASVPQTGMTRQAEAAVVQANLDQVAVVAVSQAGSHPEHGVRTLGGSVAVDAFGDIVAGPLSRTEADSVVAVIDLEKGRQAQVRSERIRPREDRRTDVYGVHYEQEVL